MLRCMAYGSYGEEGDSAAALGAVKVSNCWAFWPLGLLVCCYTRGWAETWGAGRGGMRVNDAGMQLKAKLAFPGTVSTF